MSLPECLDFDEVMEAAEEQTFGTSNAGFCIECGAYHDCCEPDAREYVCEECGEPKVYGATELIVMYG